MGDGTGQQAAAGDRFPRRTARRQQTRARILDAALREFQRVGYADATMNAIAEGADVHVTTLFVHFKAKRELAETLAEKELVGLEKLIADAQGKTPFFAFLRDLVLKVAAYRQAEGDHKRGIEQEARNEPELALHWLRYAEREVTLFAGYIAADFGIDPVDYRATMAAEIVVASGVQSYTRWRRSDGALDLVTETRAALDLAEQMARAILPAAHG